MSPAALSFQAVETRRERFEALTTGRKPFNGSQGVKGGPAVLS